MATNARAHALLAVQAAYREGQIAELEWMSDLLRSDEMVPMGVRSDVHRRLDMLRGAE